jgi:tetratricopeptide (TPR) repeat protein
VGRKRAELDQDPSTIALFEGLTELHPEDFEIWDGLAEAIFHHGHEMGYHLDRAVEALEHAYAIDSTVAPAYFHGIQSTFILQDTVRARRWSQTYLRLDGSSVFARGLRLGLALRLGSYLDRERATAALDTASAEVLNRILWFAPAGFATLESSDLVLRAAAAPRFPDSERAEAYRRLASEYRRNGHISGSLDLEDAARVLDGRDRDLFALLALRVAGILGDSYALSELDRMAGDAAYPQEAPYLSILFASQGRLEKAAEAVTWAQTAADSLALVGDTASAREMTGAALAYRGHILAAEGDTTTAMDLLRSGIEMLKPDWGGPRGLHRFSLARLLRDHGGEDEALVILRALRRPSSLEALSYLEAAGLYERRGERESARRYFNWALDLWSTADPSLSPWIDEANQGLERLDAADAEAADAGT